MGAVVAKPLGNIGPEDVQSPDLIFDIKETVHRTPYVANSVLPNLAKVDHDNEHDLLTLTSGTVVRLQTRQKDGNQGINLYKKELKSVPRELFSHPKAKDVTWLNLACNTLVYNNNGIYVDLDKVAGVHNDSESSDSDMSAVEEERPASKASKKSRSSSAGSRGSKKAEEGATEAALVIEGAEIVDAGDEADDEGEDDEAVEAAPVEATGAAVEAEGDGGEAGEAQVTPVVEIDIKPEASPVKASPEAPGVEEGEASEESESEAGLIVAPGAPVFTDDEADPVIEASAAPEAAPVESEALVALEASEAAPATAPEVEKETLTPGRPIEYAAIEDVTEEDLQQSEQPGEGLLELCDEPNPATPKEAAPAAAGVAAQDGTAVEDYSKSACDLKSVADTVDTAADFEGQSEKCDKELEHIEDDIHNIEEKPEGGEQEPVVEPVVEPVAPAVSPYDAVKAYEMQRQKDIEDAELAKILRQQEIDEANASTPSPTIPDFSEEKEPFIGPVLASDDEEGEDYDEDGETVKRLPNTVPNAFNKMMNLEELYLGYYGKGNPLRCIPSTVFTLHSLVKLDASSCRLTTIPAAVGDLSSLEELWLSGNLLKELPKSLGNLHNLRSLWVNYNQLEGVPASLSNCQNLEGLYAHGNQIMFLSTALCSLQKLKYLGLGRNKLKFLPKNIGEMVKLKEAWLNDNELRDVPESLFDIKGLKTLWLSANQLTSLDEKIGNLRKLKVLSLSKNQLTTLPFTLSNCSNLRVLALDENKLVALPRSLNQLGYLEELWLNGNAVKEIPEGLYMISNMRKPI